MGPLCDGDAENKPIKSDSAIDFTETETQPFDSQFSPSSLIGEELEAKDADELQFLQSTMPFDDTIPFEEAFETQVVNICGETQVVNLCGETQEVNLGGETQEVNLDGETQILDTQWLDQCINSDGEETDRTEVLDDTEELSDDDSMKRVENCSVDPQHMLHGTLCKEFDRGLKEKVDALSTEQHSSELRLSTATPLDKDTSEPKIGSVLGGFTSVRTASLRASGLAARRKASMGANQYVKEHIAADKEVSLINNSSIFREEIDQDHVLGQYDDQTELRNENKFRVGSSTVRKLFTEETILANEGSELPQLSYIISQEPGDLSQANALDFVDKFLETSVTDFDQVLDLGKSISEKSKHFSSAKGTQTLAKRANVRERGGGIFDWDDTHEDEGGGEFFSKKKEAFFSEGSGKVSEAREKKKLLQTRKKHSALVHSKSKLMNLEATEIKSGKNLIKEFDQQVNLDSSNGMEVVDNDKDLGDMMDVRFDTQMAAEAMEDLLCGVEGSLAEETINRAHSKENFLQNGAGSSSFGIVSRPSKLKKSVSSKLSKESSVSSKNQSNSAKKKPDGNLAKTQTRSAKKANPEKRFNTDVSDDLIKVPSKVIMQAKEGRGLEEQLNSLTPIACRTRQRRATQNQSKTVGNTSKNKRGERNDLKEVCSLKGKRKRSSTEVDDCEVLNAKEKFAKLGSKQSVELENVKLTEHERPQHKLIEELRYPKRRRTQRKGSSKQAIGQDANGQSISRGKRSKTNDISTCADLGIARQTRSSLHAGSVNTSLEASPTDRCKSSTSACVTPVNCITPVNAASPICMGDEYLKQSCRKNLAKSSLMKEINSLIASGPEPISEVKDSRRRRDMSNVRVLFSHHLDENIIKQQKKILARLGASVAFSISDATHFITDKFVRTRNMLEAIAFGKPVVTHLWLESCGQASCSIDEKNYILRDAKKEKEFGFSLPGSLALASQRPLLQGQKVFITPNTKPGKEILASLVKAVQGMAVERLGRSAMKDDKIPDDILVLSCEEDYSICVPFLEKGAAVYSSELLLNGIVTQKLEYERHRLFADHVKRTRSTIWVKKDSNHFLPVNRCK